MEDGPEPEPLGEVVDLFCGVGSLSHGLMRAGFDIRAGYDTDRRCKHAFETNNEAAFHTRDVALLQPEEILAHFSGKRPSVLAGCAPCQPFSTYKQRYDEDPRWDLVDSFARLAVKVSPDFITMENVPALLKYKAGAVFSNFSQTSAPMRSLRVRDLAIGVLTTWPSMRAAALRTSSTVILSMAMPPSPSTGG